MVYRQSDAWLRSLLCAPSLGIYSCFASATSALRVAVASLSIATTWFYILRYAFEYDGDALLRDAYVEVSEPFLLGRDLSATTWAVVAMAWSHETTSPKYQILGVFGAMSASFTLWDPAERRRPSSDGMPLHYFIAAIAGFYCVHRLKDVADIERDAAPFEFWLTALHVLLLAPKVVAFSESVQAYRIPSMIAYALLFAGVMLVHRAALQGNELSALGYAAPQTDCQISIGLDLVFAAMLTAGTIIDYYEPAKSLEASFISFGLLGVMPYITPAGALMLHLAARHYANDHGAVVGKLQRSIAKFLSRAETEKEDDGQGWVNLGYWKGTNEFVVACAGSWQRCSPLQQA